MLLMCNADRLREVAAFAFVGMNSNPVAAAAQVAHRARVVTQFQKRANNSSSERADGRRSSEQGYVELLKLETGRTELKNSSK